MLGKCDVDMMSTPDSYTTLNTYTIQARLDLCAGVVDVDGSVVYCLLLILGTAGTEISASVSTTCLG